VRTSVSVRVGHTLKFQLSPALELVAQLVQ